MKYYTFYTNEVILTEAVISRLPDNVFVERFDDAGTLIWYSESLEAIQSFHEVLLELVYLDGELVEWSEGGCEGSDA